MLLTKVIVLFAFFLILASLGTALFTFLKDKGQSERTVKALTLRIGLSITLFILLMIFNAMGWIQPHGIQ